MNQAKKLKGKKLMRNAFCGNHIDQDNSPPDSCNFSNHSCLSSRLPLSLDILYTPPTPSFFLRVRQLARCQGKQLSLTGRSGLLNGLVLG